MPVNIDGTTVQDITIDGDAVTEVTMDGDVVWTAGSEETTLIWETQADWDNAQSESMVVHEDIPGGTATNVRLGYSSTDTNYPTPLMFYQDFNGGASLGNIGSIGATGDMTENGDVTTISNELFNQSVASFDGSSDYYEMTGTDPGFTYPMSLVTWVYPTVDQNAAVVGSIDYGLEIARQAGSTASGYEWYIRSHTDGTLDPVATGIDAPSDQWTMLSAVQSSGDQMTLRINDMQNYHTSSISTSLSKQDYRFHLGMRGGYYFGGYIGPTLFFDTELSEAATNYLYDITSGSLVTGGKSV